MKSYQPHEKANIVGSIASATCVAVAALFTAGGLFQGIWMHCGYSEFQIGLITSLYSLGQCVTMIVSFWMADSVGKPLRAMGLTLLPAILYFLYLGLTFRSGSTPPFALSCVFVLVYALAYGLYSAFVYKVPELIYSLNRYGRVTAVSGIVGQLVCLAPTAFIPVLLGKSDYASTMGWLLLGSAVLILLSVGFIFFLRPLVKDIPTRPAGQKGQLLNTLRERSVRSLFLPNLARGLSMGVIGCLPMLCTHVLPLTKEQVSGFSACIVIATVIGYAIPMIFPTVSGTARLLVFASVGLLGFSAALCFSGNLTVLFLLFLCVEVCYAAVNLAVPVLAIHYVPFEFLGGYTAIRMGATMAGSTVASAVVGAVLSAVPGKSTALVILAVGGLLQVYCGLAYRLYKSDKTEIAKETETNEEESQK